ncbi:MAG: nicotinate-nucleotide--dimethylbenzimidazole phosphoribosyltransferase [Hyphomicrobiaceae bacterium]
MALQMFTNRNDLSRIMADLPVGDLAAQDLARGRQGELTKPPGSLGRLEDVAIHLAGWHGGRPLAPKVSADVIKVVIFAGNHGVVARGVSPYPADVTAQMVGNFSAGGAAINALTEAFGLSLDVVALDLDKPTRDMTIAPAMSEVETIAALNIGAGVVGDDIDVLCLGEMGIGNTTVAAALCSRALGGRGKDWAGPGTGLDAGGVSHKASVIDQAIKCHAALPLEAFETLRCVGGRETAAIAGAVLAARMKRIPVVLDGYVVSAAIAPLFAEEAGIVAHCIAGHVSAEPAHSRLLQHLGLSALLDLSMRLGEGSGAALGAQIIRAAAATHNNMATFAEAAVSNRAKEQGDDIGHG